MNSSSVVVYLGSSLVPRPPFPEKNESLGTRLPGPILGLAQLLLLTVLQVTAAGSNAQGTAGWPCSQPPSLPSDQSFWGEGTTS